ncbi:hypothetical protein KSS87_008846 [Heliosperma pusillum]|nr:hypothetical protein KSS87_008846 [Heliosperma pusillum]
MLRGIVLPFLCFGAFSASTLYQEEICTFCRNGASSGSSLVCSMLDKFNECKETPKKCGASYETLYTPLLKTNTTLDQKFSFDVKSEVKVLHSETPPARPFVPRLKRIQEDCANLDDKNKFNVPTASKRAKFVQESKPENNKAQEVVESPSKFEWLHPSRIRDANGKGPADPFFDKRTLYIPPDILKKMSASQKQYWSVKCQYMDVLLFFKVGKFYELYELDAEIGHKELDWKMTMSGVGKCRQVGISESGIDDAVQKLVARG